MSPLSVLHGVVKAPLRALCLVAITLILTSCITVSKRLVMSSSQGGSFSTNAAELFAGLTWVETVSVHAGEPRMEGVTGLRTRGRTSCTVEKQVVDVYWVNISPEKGRSQSLCRDIANAIVYVTSKSERRPNYRVAIAIVPSSWSYVKRSLSIYPLLGRIRFQFPWNEGHEERSIANIVDSVAHEVLHVTASVARVPRARRRNEYEAYLAGFCAQLDVLGVADARPLRGTNKIALARGDKGVKASLEARPQVAEQLLHMGVGSVVRKDSLLGGRVLSRCGHDLTNYFKSKNGIRFTSAPTPMANSAPPAPGTSSADHPTDPGRR